MARREWGLRKQCAHPGCPEVARYTYATRRDLETSYEMKHEFRCTRHSKPEEVLSAENMTTEVVMVSKKSDGCGDHLYWDRNGFQHGPGFKAWADDFPEGTRLIVTARIEFPNGEVRGASVTAQPACEASSREAATSTVVLGAVRPGKD